MAQSQIYATLPSAAAAAPPPPPPPVPPAPAGPTSLSIQDMIRQEADKAGVPWQLALAVAEQESSFNPRAIGPPLPSGASAIGLFQLLPDTAKTFGVDPNDPHDNIVGGVKYLRQLLDRYQGDPSKALATYGGVVRDTKYVPGVLARMQKYNGQAAAAPGAPTKPPEPGFWGTLADSLDPHERQGRQNIAGAIGSIGGGVAGAFFGGGGGAAGGTLVEPGGGTLVGAGAGALWGRRAGSAVGAGLGGALEQGLVEETGIGDWLSKNLPWGQQDEPSTPDPNSTFASRTGGAALNQGASDLVGQAVMKPINVLAKRGLQTSIGKAAAEKLGAARDAASAAFDQTRLSLGEQVRAARQAATDAMASLQATITARMEALRVSQEVGAIRPARAARVAVQDAGRQRAATLGASHDAEIALAQARAAAAVAGATGTRDAALGSLAVSHERGLAAAAPSASEAGRSVAEVFEKASQVPKRNLGAAIDEAAASGPVKDIRALKAEAARIQKEELLPRVFPNQQAAATVDAILNESNVVSFQRLHELKSELQEAMRNVSDKASRTQMQGAVLHLSKLMRETLSGFKPYDEATKAYADVIPRYSSALAKTIRKAARTSPEDIAQMISADKPTQARFLTELMTDAAAEGGNAAGGRKALENVQDVWFYKNVLEGPLDTLGERLTKLKRSPEFVKSFLSDPRASGLITRAEQLAGEYPKMVALHEGRIAAAKAAGAAEVGTATKAKDAALSAHKQATTADIRRATEALTREVDAARAARVSAKASDTAEKVTLKRTHADRIEDAVRAKEQATSPQLDAVTEALKRLDKSTLGGKNLRSPVQVGADLIGALRPTSVFSGLSTMRFLMGASDADIARFVVHSKLPVRALTRMFITGPELPLLASHGVKAAAGKSMDARSEKALR